MAKLNMELDDLKTVLQSVKKKKIMVTSVGIPFRIQWNEIVFSSVALV